MKSENLLRALGTLDAALVEHAAPDRVVKRRGAAVKRWTVIAASLALVLAAALFVGLLDPFALWKSNTQAPPSSGNGQKPDVVYGVWFNNYFYTPLHSDIYLSVYPELEALLEKTQTGIHYRITEEMLGEYVGSFPALTQLGYGQGEAYRFVAYPTYDSILIVRQDETLRFYTAQIDNPPGSKKDSDTLLSHCGIPTRVLSLKLDDGETTAISADAMEGLAQLLRGKTHFDPREISREKYERWQQERDDGGVHMVDGELIFDSYEIREEYAHYYGSTIHSIFLQTDNGFDVRMIYDPDFGYFSLCSCYYRLSEYEVAAINTLLGIAP